MARYWYEARNSEGELVQGYVEAETPADVLPQLRRQSLTMESIRLATTNPLPQLPRRQPQARPETSAAPRSSAVPPNVPFPQLLPAHDTLQHYLEVARRNGRELATGLAAYARELPRGPLQAETLRLASVLGDTTPSVERPSDARPDVTLLPLIDPQIESNGLAALLPDLLSTYGVTDDTRRRVLAALAYPLIVALIGLLLLVVFSFWVAPQFAVIFREFQTSMPPGTELVLKSAEWVRRDYVIIALLGLSLLGVLWWLTRGLLRRGLIESLPLLGRTAWEHRLGRLTARAASLLRAELDASTALWLAAQEIPQGPLRAWTEKLAEDVAAGNEPPSTPRDNGLPHQVQLIFREPLANQERATMLKRLSAVYLAQSRGRLSWLVSALEPMAIVVVGVLVGFNIAALMLPLVSLISNLSA